MRNKQPFKVELVRLTIQLNKSFSPSILKLIFNKEKTLATTIDCVGYTDDFSNTNSQPKWHPMDVWLKENDRKEDKLGAQDGLDILKLTHKTKTSTTLFLLIFFFSEEKSYTLIMKVYVHMVQLN